MQHHEEVGTYYNDYLGLFHASDKQCAVAARSALSRVSKYNAIKRMDLATLAAHSYLFVRQRKERRNGLGVLAIVHSAARSSMMIIRRSI